MQRRASLLLAALVITGCGAATPETASLWVTHGRGTQVALERSVPAGLSAIRALEHEADIETSYGGRYVDDVDGVAGSTSKQESWFYFVNGIEADRGAADYRVRSGDVIWWDRRPWSNDSMRQPVVVGAFPEPFLHGYDGHVRPAVVRYGRKDAEAVALGLANLVGSESVDRIGVPADPDANLLQIVDRDVPFSAALRSPDGAAGSPVVFTISIADAQRLLDEPERAQFRYEGLP